MKDFKILINVCTIEAGGVVGATPQNYSYKLSICCSTPETMAYLDFKWSKSKFYGTFNELKFKIAA